MAREPDNNEDHRLTEILQKANPAPQTQAAKPFGSNFQIAPKGGKHVIDRRRIIISNRTRKNQPLRRSLRLMLLGVVILVVPLMFSVERTQAPKNTVIRPIVAIAVDHLASRNDNAHQLYERGAFQNLFFKCMPASPIPATRHA